MLPVQHSLSNHWLPHLPNTLCDQQNHICLLYNHHLHSQAQCPREVEMLPWLMILKRTWEKQLAVTK
jgi:hypothetical protein